VLFKGAYYGAIGEAIFWVASMAIVALLS
jgi:hypothetical protein